jgi:hypothetical protein
MMVRINAINASTSVAELRRGLKHFGKLGAVSIHSDGQTTYGLAETSEETYQALDDAIEEENWDRRKDRGPGPKFTVEVANHCRGPWLSHDWHPPLSILKNRK